MRAIGKAIAFILTFVLGFFACIGAIVGVGIYAYTSVSIDTLRGFGVEISTEEFLDPDAEVPVDTMTLQKLVEEIQYLSSIGETATLNMLIERYGIKIPADYEQFVPDSIRDITLSSLFSEEGINSILSETEVDFILGFVPEGIISEQAIEALSGKTLDYVVAMDLGYLLDGVLLGYVTGATYEKNEAGEYEIVYADPNAPTTIELIAGIDLGALLTSITGGETNTFEVIRNYVGDVMVDSLVSSFNIDLATFPLPGLFSDKTVADLIKLDEESGEYSLDIMALLSERRLGEILDYTYNADDDAWYDADGAAVDALFGAVCSVSCDELMDPGVVSETGEARTQIDVIFDALGDLMLGHLMNYEFGDPDGSGEEFWYQGSGDDITLPESAEEAFLDIKISSLLGDDPVNDAFGTLYVGDLMGYIQEINAEYNPEDPDSVEYIWLDADGKEIGSLYAKLADYTVSGLMDGGFDADDLMDGLVIADVLELEALENLPVFMNASGNLELVDDFDGGIVVWVDNDGVPANNMMNAIADLSISDVGDEMNSITLGDICGVVEYQNKWYSWEYDGANNRIVLTADDSLITDLAHISIEQFANNDFEDEIQSIKIGRFIGYTLGDDGKWYDEGALVEGGIISAFTDLTLDDLKNENSVQDAVQGIAVAEVLGFTYNEESGKWTDDAGNEVTGVMREIADCNVGELNNKVQSMQIGDIAGFTKIGEKWFADDNEEATGILAVLADLTINEVTDESIIADKILTITVADIFGYTKDGDAWLNDGKKVHGVMAVIAGAEVGKIQEALDVTKMGYILGYEHDNEGWIDPNTNERVDGLMSAVSDTTFDDLDNLYTKLRISDIIPEEELESGFLSIIPKDTTLNNVGDAINSTFNNTSISELIEKGIVKLDESTCSKLDTVCAGHIGEEGREKTWDEYALPDAIQHIVDDLFDIIERFPSIPKT